MIPSHIKEDNPVTQFTDSNADLIQKQVHRHTQNMGCVEPIIWAPCGPVEA